MPASIVLQIDVKGPETYEEYKALAPPSIEAYGGRARGWWESAEYAGARSLRQRAASSEMILVAGLPSVP